MKLTKTSRVVAIRTLISTSREVQQSSRLSLDITLFLFVVNVSWPLLFLSDETDLLRPFTTNKKRVISLKIPPPRVADGSETRGVMYFLVLTFPVLTFSDAP
mgnify:CR=1 FL=1